MDEARALLEQLMGRERDIPVDKRTNRSRKIWDDDICKPYLCGLCPYVDFRNTRSDLGEHPPNQDHDPDVKAQWDKLSEDEKDKYGYERDLMTYLMDLVVTCDRRVEKNKERLRLEQGDDNVKDSQIARLIDMERVMSEKMELSEKQAEEGLVDEAQALLAEVARMREHKSAIEKQMAEKNENSKRDIVCEVSGNIMLVSGNILSSAENEERIRCHFQGKQYLGWKAVRDKLKELKEKFENKPIRERSREVGASGGGGGGGDRDRERDR
ncbi:unnamed protein product, partial [Ectocarpus sp. 12 AP-2014]